MFIANENLSKSTSTIVDFNYNRCRNVMYFQFTRLQVSSTPVNSPMQNHIDL